MLDQQKKSTLPQRQMQPYNGDPLEFCSFVQSFEYNIENKTADSMDRIYYLEQYTTGEANRLVKGLLNCDPKKHVIADAFKKKAEGWPVIKREEIEEMKKNAEEYERRIDVSKHKVCFKRSTTLDLVKAKKKVTEVGRFFSDEEIEEMKKNAEECERQIPSLKIFKKKFRVRPYFRVGRVTPNQLFFRPND